MKYRRFFLISGILMLASELWKQYTLTFPIGGGSLQLVVFPLPALQHPHVRLSAPALGPQPASPSVLTAFWWISACWAVSSPSLTPAACTTDISPSRSTPLPGISFLSSWSCRGSLGPLRCRVEGLCRERLSLSRLLPGRHRDQSSLRPARHHQHVLHQSGLSHDPEGVLRYRRRPGRHRGHPYLHQCNARGRGCLPPGLEELFLTGTLIFTT